MRTTRTPARLLLALLLLLAPVACGRLDDESTLDEIPETDQAKEDMRRGFDGVLSSRESDCVFTKLTARSDITIGQIRAYATAPVQTGPVFEAYKQIIPSCIEPNASVTPKPPSDEMRRGFISGAKGSLPSATDDQISCLLDEMVASGVTSRDLVLAGYIPAEQERLIPKVQAAAPKCGLG